MGRFDRHELVAGARARPDRRCVLFAAEHLQHFTQAPATIGSLNATAGNVTLDLGGNTLTFNGGSLYLRVAASAKQSNSLTLLNGSVFGASSYLNVELGSIGSNGLLHVGLGANVQLSAEATVNGNFDGGTALAVTDGGDFQTSSLQVYSNTADVRPAHPVVDVSGQGSLLKGGYAIDSAADSAGNPSLVVEKGGSFQSTYFDLGLNAARLASVVVRDSTSEFTASSSIIVGQGNGATFSLLNGATATTGWIWVGEGGGAGVLLSTLNLDGKGTSWSVSSVSDVGIGKQGGTGREYYRRSSDERRGKRRRGRRR